MNIMLWNATEFSPFQDVDFCQIFKTLQRNVGKFVAKNCGRTNKYILLLKSNRFYVKFSKCVRFQVLEAPLISATDLIMG